MTWLNRIWWSCVLLGLGLAVAVTVSWEPDRQIGPLVANWAKEPSTFVELDSMQAHIRDTGPRNDPVPIVLLHGMASSLHSWEGWQQELQKTRRVISVDLPGFGLTGPSPQGEYHIDAYTRFVLRLLDSLGVKRVMLVGNALGGEVAWQTAILAPERVRKLVLIDSDGYAQSALSMPVAFQIASARSWRWIAERILPRAVVESSVRSVFGDPSKVTPEKVQRYFELALRVGNRRALFQRMDQAQWGASSHMIRRVQQPTLVLWGLKDGMVSPANGSQFCREIQHCTLVTFPGLGHIPQEEDPQQTLKAAMPFLAQSASTAPRK
ncbi:alpha/beta hydrolase [Aquabacterium sp.]|uniref:alpha/beta fold hydrolase n=1 Tax=Aquabacterium sp. TaxID=1872578 RepID=UPI002487568F|nr:alpha/beta hydrolase [Aquabacterium sp.]MDI1258529.1 alpha/beta hydrolase [Aquabacterium sp.]